MRTFTGPEIKIIVGPIVVIPNTAIDRAGYLQTDSSGCNAIEKGSDDALCNKLLPNSSIPSTNRKISAM